MLLDVAIMEDLVKVLVFFKPMSEYVFKKTLVTTLNYSPMSPSSLVIYMLRFSELCHPCFFLLAIY